MLSPFEQAVDDSCQRRREVVGMPNIVLGFNNLSDYETKNSPGPHFGATIGRCANRIANGRNLVVRRDGYFGKTGVARVSWTYGTGTLNCNEIAKIPVPSDA
jgi:Aldose 1-epimerase